MNENTCDIPTDKIITVPLDFVSDTVSDKITVKTDSLAPYGGQADHMVYVFPNTLSMHNLTKV